MKRRNLEWAPTNSAAVMIPAQSSAEDLRILLIKKANSWWEIRVYGRMRWGFPWLLRR